MNTDVRQAPQLSTGRLLLLGVSSVILCISFIMSLFAPFPLALAIILYGRLKGILTGLLGVALSLGFALLVHKDLTLVGFYICVFIFALAIAEVSIRGISPIKGIVGFGLGFILTLSGVFGYYLHTKKQTMEQFVLSQLEKSADKIAEQKKLVEESQEEDSFQVAELLGNPKLMAKEFVSSAPSYFFMGVFLMLWFNMYMVLKSRRLLLSGQHFDFSEWNLLHFKVPFELVIVLIVGLVLAVWGDRFGTGPFENIGLTIIKCLGIFYFFQGFGVFSDFLNFIGIGGFFRTLVVMLVIFTANYIIAIAGLLDNWFDFRKYFIKQRSE